ncbi:hypothetical protein C8F04DRAFT_1400471 [Mycena alexandri]|uniref:Uncharacterized protein n=1 Tax=Mycena alexandri TaxID=1745969 RepID=A0AAD6WUC7_9AGAR|nr:hypothetical protein C8F04DRAFT_1400471 [Mycena alexandri]
MVTDGGMYFGIIVIANLANLLTFYNKKLQLQGFVSKQPIVLRTLEDEDNVNIDSIDSDEEDQDGHGSEEKGNVSASGDEMDSEDEKILDPMADANEDKEENETTEAGNDA